MHMVRRFKKTEGRGGSVLRIDEPEGPAIARFTDFRLQALDLGKGADHGRGSGTRRRDRRDVHKCHVARPVYISLTSRTPIEGLFDVTCSDRSSVCVCAFGFRLQETIQVDGRSRQ